MIYLTLLQLQETAPAAHRSHPQRGTARWRRPGRAPWLGPRPAAPPGPARRRPPTTCRRRPGTSLGNLKGNWVVWRWCFWCILDPLWSTPKMEKSWKKSMKFLSFCWKPQLRMGILVGEMPSKHVDLNGKIHPIHADFHRKYIGFKYLQAGGFNQPTRDFTNKNKVSQKDNGIGPCVLTLWICSKFQSSIFDKCDRCCIIFKVSRIFLSLIYSGGMLPGANGINYKWVQVHQSLNVNFFYVRPKHCCSNGWCHHG